MSGAAWFHVTRDHACVGTERGRGHRTCDRAAREAGARVSFDLNYRRKLWTESEAQRVVGPLLKDVDLVVANEEDLQSVLGIHVAGTDVAAGRLPSTGSATRRSV